MEVCETPSRHQPRYGQSSCQSVPTRAKHSEHRGLQSNYQMLDASVIFGILLGGRKTIVEVKLMKDMEDPKDKPLTLDTSVTHQSDPTVRS